MDSYTEIIRAFSRDLSSEFTIRQVSKQINKSYAYTNTKCRELISQGILHKKIVGASILCRLNYANDVTIALLALSSAAEKDDKLGKAKDDAESLRKALKNSADVIILNDNKFCIIARDELECNDKLSLLKVNADVISLEQLKQLVRDNQESIILIHGFENFWRMVSDAK